MVCLRLLIVVCEGLVMSGCGCEKRSQEEESKDSYLSYLNHVLSVISESEERGRRGGFHCYYAAILSQETSNDFSHTWYQPLLPSPLSPATLNFHCSYPSFHSHTLITTSHYLSLPLTTTLMSIPFLIAVL